MQTTAQDVAQSLFKRHPLQRLSSPSRGFSAAVHIAGLLSFAFSFIYLAEHPNAINEAWGSHMQYLTIIGLTLATLTFSFGILSDLTLSPQLFLLKNACAVGSVPLAVLISILYWGLQAVDPQLVVPDWLPRLPLYADLGFHAAPAILLAIDLFFLSPPWTISALPSLVLSGSIAAAYWVWIELCYSHNGFYPYPILDTTTPLRAGIFASAALVMALNTYFLKWLYTMINGKPVEAGMVTPPLSDLKRV